MSVNTDNMTDEEFADYMNSLSDEEETQEESEETTEDQSEAEANLEDTNAEEDEQEVDDTTESDDDDSQETAETDSSETEEESQPATEEETDDDESEDTEEETQETSEVDYKAFYEKVTADFKANGKTMPGFKNPEDFITALSMASNYAQKTTALKPHLGRIKMLKDISDAELNEMMDFRNRNPEVIKKALKEANIDIMELDPEEKVTYSPKDYTVSQAEVEFDEVLEEIQGTPEFVRTSEVVTKVWDEKSKAAVIANPHLLRGLNEEIAMGRFDTIQGIIQQKRMLGQMNGMSDLEMYQELATEMQAQAYQEHTKTSTVKVEVPDTKPKVEDPAIKDQKKKAGISTKKSTKSVKQYDPATLDDEEFMKLVEQGAKFIN